MSERDNKAIIREMYEEVFNRHDAEAFRRYMTADVVDHDPLIYGQPPGPEGVVAGLRMLFEAFPDLHVDLQQLVAEGDTVVARLWLSGTNTGPYRGLPEPTGRQTGGRAIFVFRLVDGKIAEIRGVADRMEILTKLGILPDIG